ncbi:hypothetical protein [Cellvibrio japonicus]|uniref:hypothetical protein n=1 Tax=Cellvibrio japonicus TaxID=155077 RepID=UPI001653366B|nr:hypothetical protein [Cellvibrio japonicus]
MNWVKSLALLKDSVGGKRVSGLIPVNAPILPESLVRYGYKSCRIVLYSQRKCEIRRQD